MIMMFGGKYYDDIMIYGGYFDYLVCEEDYIICILENFFLDVIVSLFCVGIIVYFLMKYYGFDKLGMYIGVVGLGGLGYVVVKFVKVMGIKVIVISILDRKRDEVLIWFGVDLFLVSCDSEQMKDVMGIMDGIIDIVFVFYLVFLIFDLFKYKGKFIMVGVFDKLFEFLVLFFIFGKSYFF